MKHVALSAALALAAGALIGAGPARIASNHTISVRDDSYSRSSITIPRGDKVTWKWRDTDNDHNVTGRKSNPVFFRSKTEDGRFSYAHRFSKTGTYKLFCTIHPSLMKITVKVTR